MIIDLSRIGQEPRTFPFTLRAGWWRADEKAAQIVGPEGPVEAEITIFRAGEQFVLEGRVSGRLLLRCDRCLEPFPFPLDAHFRISLSCAPPGGSQEEVKLAVEEMGVGFIEGEELDLGDVVREQIYLSAPMKCLCNEQCAGLCPECGANLNQGPCSCPPRRGHPAFSVLKNLKLVKE